MSLNFAGISPHPPLILPEIAEPTDLAKVGETVLGMKKLATDFKNAEIDTLVVVSPHGLIYPDKFNICAMKKLFGTFASFGHPDLIVEGENDIDFVSHLKKVTDENTIPSVFYDNGGEFYELDHGVMVPVKYLVATADNPFKIVPISYSNLDRAHHFAFGQALKDAAQASSERIGILASGDLSHQLIQNSDGKVFDETLVQDIKDNNTKEIIYYDEEFVENAGECGYRSILVLLGALDGIDAKPEVLSYEGPYGVGYLVANYELRN